MMRSFRINTNDPYKILGVATTASIGEINHAFKRRALETHPDRTGGTKEAFQQVNAAYQKVLKMHSAKNGVKTNADRYSERSSQERAKELKKEKRKAYALIGIISTITLISGVLAFIIR